MESIQDIKSNAESSWTELCMYILAGYSPSEPV